MAKTQLFWKNTGEPIAEVPMKSVAGNLVEFMAKCGIPVLAVGALTYLVGVHAGRDEGGKAVITGLSKYADGQAKNRES